MDMGRRAFVGTAAMAAAGCAVGGGRTGAQFVGWTKGHFQIHFTYTGASESMFLIFPDGTTMLLDCGDFDAASRGDLALPLLPDDSRHAGEWIARYVKRVNPNGSDVDYMLISHFHRDHMGTVKWCKDVVRRGNRDYHLTGFSLAAEMLHFRKAIDRTGGAFDSRELFEPSENQFPYLLDCIYGYLKARDGLEVEKLRLGATDQIVCRHGGVDGFSVKNICANGRLALADGGVLDTLRRDGKMPWYWNENHLSCGHVFTYGKFRFFTAGDFSGPAMDARGVTILPEEHLAKTLTGPVSVAKVNHHGYKSMPDSLLRALRAKVYAACTWDVLHLTDDCLARFANPSNCEKGTLLVPGNFGATRRTVENAAGRALFPDAVYGGIHSIIDVPPGGETFTLSLVDARDEDMRVIYSRLFSS
jgi:glyoxylase-like metal-dependent hydrolase (beta-lactamase superfamily II)